MITTAIGLFGWISFLISLPLVALSFIFSSYVWFVVAAIGGALGLALVFVTLATKGLVFLFRL